jgi:hypothetical protein
MIYEKIKKSIIFIIVFLLIGSCIIPHISGKQIIKNSQISMNVSDSTVYPQTPDWISSNPHYSTGGALADFNNDGWLDLVVADGNDMGVGKVNVYYNNGDGSYPTTADWQSSDTGYNGHLDVADVNGDGWPDVAVSYLGTSSSFGPIARLYLNDDGVLSNLPVWEADITGNSFGVDFGDMNGDGWPDLAVATGWSYSPQHFYKNYVYLNNDGDLETSASWESDDNNHYLGCLWLDADDDGWLDLAYISSFQETQIYKNLEGMLETTASWHTTDSSSQDGIMLTVGDVTSDGIPELFATDNTQLGGSGLFKQYTGLEEGYFEDTYSWNYFGNYGSAVALADVDGDNKLDLATGSWWGNTDIFINEGSGLPTSPSWTSGLSSVIEKILFGNIGPTLNERTLTEYFYPDDDRRLFHLERQPIQYIQSVYLDDELLDSSEYTYSREHGWISVGSTPSESIKVVYKYSKSMDMVITNWDSNKGNYLYYNRLLFPDLDCSGDLVWNNISPGEIIYDNFDILNIGDPESELDWEIESYPDWGEWTFEPSDGDDLMPEDGPFIVYVEVKAPNEGNDEYIGEVKIVNKNDPDDFYIFDVFLSVSGPDLDCDGNLQWNDVNPGSTVQGSFTIENIGADGSLLNWKINSTPNWGDWIFSPNNGNDLTPENGPLTINVEVKAPNENNKGFSGKITVINKDNPLDSCEIDVVLNTPKLRLYKNNVIFQQPFAYLKTLEIFYLKLIQMLFT